MIIHDKELPVITNILYQIFSPHGKLKKIDRFQTMSDFHDQVNFDSRKDAVNGFYKLQSRQAYEGCHD